MAVEWRFAPDDVARLRFAFSPIWELVTSLRVLRHPGRHPLHLPWVRAVRPRVRELDLGELFALVPMSGYFPDFLTPPPDTTLPGFHAELERVRETPPKTALEELDEVAQAGSPDPARLAAFAADPAAGIQRVAAALERYWELGLAEFWPRVHAMLEADVMWRSRRLAAGGVRELFADLHDAVTWHGDRLLIRHHCDHVSPITGDGLLLVPSAFRGPEVALMWEPYQQTLWYPARGIGNLWAAGAPCTPNALAALVGRTRAQILVALEDPATTTALARRLELTPGAVSQHLTILSDSGVVTSRRLGREVVYRRTATGDALTRSGL
ncbi:winged helix-turn-helix transcriptional regulator [Streptosporangiaceae bacterium NEAU-GS5]|nr:winged helix-turn-helix transcriptional regulator [Streptosporangiaceae bacterium NEAU-GS5]